MPVDCFSRRTKRTFRKTSRKNRDTNRCGRLDGAGTIGPAHREQPATRSDAVLRTRADDTAGDFADLETPRRDAFPEDL